MIIRTSVVTACAHCTGDEEHDYNQTDGEQSEPDVITTWSQPLRRACKDEQQHTFGRLSLALVSWKPSKVRNRQVRWTQLRCCADGA